MHACTGRARLKQGLAPVGAAIAASHVSCCSWTAAVQVGSKNAAFFMGRSVKVCTKRAKDTQVHQLCIDAEKLEHRYRNRQVTPPHAMQQLPAHLLRDTIAHLQIVIALSISDL